MKRIVLALLLSFTSTSAFAQSLQTFSVKGTVPSNVSMEITGLVSGTFTAFPTISDTDFENGKIAAFSNPIALANIRANTPVIVKIQNNGWTLPPDYDVANGPKKADGSDGQFQLRVETASINIGNGTLQAQGGFATAFTGVTNTAAPILKLGNIDSVTGKKTGVQNGTLNITPQILLDSAFDVPGDYEVALEMTYSAQN